MVQTLYGFTTRLRKAASLFFGLLLLAGPLAEARAQGKLFDSLRRGETEAIELLGVATATKEEIKACNALWDSGVDAFNAALGAWAGGNAKSAEALANQGNEYWLTGCYQPGCSSMTCNTAIGFTKESGPAAYLCYYCDWPPVPSYSPLKHVGE